MNLTQGLHCKACDVSLVDAFFDPELCPTCMGVVLDVNSDLHDTIEAEPEIELWDDEEDES